jgi:hypothetical protein
MASRIWARHAFTALLSVVSTLRVFEGRESMAPGKLSVEVDAQLELILLAGDFLTSCQAARAVHPFQPDAAFEANAVRLEKP